MERFDGARDIICRLVGTPVGDHNQWKSLRRYFRENLAPRMEVLDAGEVPADHIDPETWKHLQFVPTKESSETWRNLGQKVPKP